MVPSWAREAVVKREINGIDVSAWQPNITQGDWIKMLTDYQCRFAFIKATEGTQYISRTFANDFYEAKMAGILRGAYHFYSRGVDPIKQADFFLNALGPVVKGDLPPVLDLEHPKGLIESDLEPALAILRRFEEKTGATPIIYCGPYGFHGLGSRALTSGIEKYPLWLAHYTSGNPWMPKPWSKLTFWQYTSSGSSTEGPIDHNWFNGSMEELQAMTIGSQPKSC